MPFLPTLAVVVALAAASAFCPSTERAAPVATAAALAAPSPTAFAGPIAVATPAAVAAPARLPASLAFAEAFPSPSVTGAGHGALRPRATQRLAAAAKKACPVRGCLELPHCAATLPPGDADPLAVARVDGSGDAAEDGFLPPLALPFAAVQASMARTLAPAARLVGEAAELMRGGGAAVKGSVVQLAQCLP